MLQVRQEKTEEMVLLDLVDPLAPMERVALAVQEESRDTRVYQDHQQENRDYLPLDNE